VAERQPAEHEEAGEVHIGCRHYSLSFNQYLVVDDEPLLFHTGMSALFAQVSAAVARVLDPARLRHVAFSHFEADECGALNPWLAAAPRATPLCGAIGAMVSIGDQADRPPRGLADGEIVVLGAARRVTWIDAPHVPHGWDCGFLFEASTRTLLCGDLFTQPGADNPPLTDGDILGPSEAMRRALDYYAHAPSTRATLGRLAALEPRTLACMHGCSAWQGDGTALLRALADRLE
jgi:flavorubredoxin